MMLSVAAAGLMSSLLLVVARAETNQTSVTSVCSLPAVTGPCKAYFERWYYDEGAKECKQFVYGGCQGNANNFETLAECNSACRSVTSVCSLPAVTGPCKAYFQRWYYDEGAKECKQFVYGGCQGNANNFETLAECNSACSSVTSVCSLPAVTGPCKAYFQRWYYDEGAKECKQFVYGGCQGNANNFETLAECNSACSSVPPGCSLPAVTGPCKAYFLRWYYDADLKKCKQFVYGGCQGNANNYETENLCLQTCVRRGCRKSGK